ncbi:MAG: hypothetical protein JW827_06175 [Spirochaetes bacterium]|nr:hypothetical protein [Spirochaetota bacterium]
MLRKFKNLFIKRSFSKRIRKILIFFILAFLLLFTAAAVIYKIYVTRDFVRQQAITFFKTSFNRDISLSVKRISLFRGIEIEDLVIYNTPQFNKSKFIEIKRLRIRYNILWLALFKIKIKEISLIQPRVYLQYDADEGVWNYSDLAGPPGKKQPEPEKKPGPIKISLDMKKFEIRDLSVRIASDQFILLKGLNIQSRVKLDEPSLKGIRRLFLDINTTGDKNLVYQKENLKLNIPLDLKMGIDIRSRKEARADIRYVLKDQIVEMNKKIINIPDIKFVFNCGIFLDEGMIKLDRISLDVNKNTIINLSGSVFDIEKVPRIDLSSKSNEFNMASLNDLAKIFLEDPGLRTSGKFKISQMALSTLEKRDFPFSMALTLKDFNFISPKNKLFLNKCFLSFTTRKIPAQIKSSFQLFAKRIKASSLEIENLDIESSAYFNDKFVLKSVTLDVTDTLINKGEFNLSYQIKDRNIRGRAVLKKLNLARLSKGLSGTLSLTNYTAGPLTRLLLKTDLSIPDMKFSSAIGTNFYSSENINLKLSSKIVKEKDIIDISNISFTLNDFLRLLIKGEYDQRTKGLEARIETFDIVAEDLIKVLPDPVKYSMPFEGVKGVIATKGYVNMKDDRLTARITTTNSSLLLENVDSGFLINGFVSRLDYKSQANRSSLIYRFKATNIENKIAVSSTNARGERVSQSVYEPFAEKVDLVSSVNMTPENIEIKSISLQVPDLNLVSHIAGKVTRVKKKNRVNLTFDFDLAPPEKITFLKDSLIDGSLNIRAFIMSLTDDLIEVKGRINFNDLHFKMKDLGVEAVNGFFPFTHLVGKRDVKLSLLERSALKDLVTLNYPQHRGYNPPPDNFSIRTIRMKDIKIEDIRFDMNYSDNFMTLNRVFCRVSGGTISVNNSYIDLADLNPANFKYQFNIETSNLDVAKLFNVKVGKDENTKISINTKFKGQGASMDNLGELYGAFNITSIGDALALKLLDVMDPQKKNEGMNSVRDILEGGASPELISMEIKFGQIYPKFWYKNPPSYNPLNLYKNIMLLLEPPSPIEIEPPIPMETIIRNMMKKS